MAESNETKEIMVDAYLETSPVRSEIYEESLDYPQENQLSAHTDQLGVNSYAEPSEDYTAEAFHRTSPQVDFNMDVDIAGNIAQESFPDDDEVAYVIQPDDTELNDDEQYVIVQPEQLSNLNRDMGIDENESSEVYVINMDSERVPNEMAAVGTSCLEGNSALLEEEDNQVVAEEVVEIEVPSFSRNMESPQLGENIFEDSVDSSQSLNDPLTVLPPDLPPLDDSGAASVSCLFPAHRNRESGNVVVERISYEMPVIKREMEEPIVEIHEESPVEIETTDQGVPLDFLGISDRSQVDYQQFNVTSSTISARPSKLERGLPEIEINNVPKPKTKRQVDGNKKSNETSKIKAKRPVKKRPKPLSQQPRQLLPCTKPTMVGTISDGCFQLPKLNLQALTPIQRQHPLMLLHLLLPSQSLVQPIPGPTGLTGQAVTQVGNVVKPSPLPARNMVVSQAKHPTSCAVTFSSRPEAVSTNVSAMIRPPKIEPAPVSTIEVIPSTLQPAPSSVSKLFCDMIQNVFDQDESKKSPAHSSVKKHKIKTKEKLVETAVADSSSDIHKEIRSLLEHRKHQTPYVAFRKGIAEKDRIGSFRPDPETLADLYMKNWKQTGRYQCKFCPYSSVTKNYLFRHWLVHHNSAEAYKCAYCEFRATYRDCITRHQSLNHKGQEKQVWIDTEVHRDTYNVFQTTFGMDFNVDKPDDEEGAFMEEEAEDIERQHLSPDRLIDSSGNIIEGGVYHSITHIRTPPKKRKRLDSDFETKLIKEEPGDVQKVHNVCPSLTSNTVCRDTEFTSRTGDTIPAISKSAETFTQQNHFYHTVSFQGKELATRPFHNRLNLKTGKYLYENDPSPRVIPDSGHHDCSMSPSDEVAAMKAEYESTTRKPLSLSLLHHIKSEMTDEV